MKEMPWISVAMESRDMQVNKLEFCCNKNFPNEALNPIVAHNLEQLLSARLR